MHLVKKKNVQAKCHSFIRYLFLYDDSYDDSNLGPRLYYDYSLQKNLNEEKKKSK